MTQNTLHVLTSLIPILSVGVHLVLSPAITPLWMSLPGRWPQIIAALTSFVGTTLTAQASGQSWADAAMAGVAGLATTGLLGHGISQVLPSQPAAPAPAAPPPPAPVTPPTPTDKPASDVKPAA